MALPEELVEEVLLCLPAAEPAWLFRAAVVCKPWRRLVSEPRFRRLYREFHRSPPTLGYLCNVMCAGANVARFVPTASSHLPAAAALRHGDRNWWRPLGVCHGLVLLEDAGVSMVDRPNPFKKGFLIWDPITDQSEELPPLVHPAALGPHSWKAAIVCAAGGLGGTGTRNCDHLDCHGLSFLVVLLVTTSDSWEVFTYMYSSEAAAWGPQMDHPHLSYRNLGVTSDPGVFLGKALYFQSRVRCYSCIIKYDLATRQMSVISLPVINYLGHIVVMPMEDGRMGFATIVNSKQELWLWSRSWDSGHTTAEWRVSRVIDLQALFTTFGEPTCSFVVGCAGNPAVIFLLVDGLIFTVDLNSSQIMEVCKATWPVDVFSYLSFCTPGSVQATDSEQVPQVFENH